MNEELMNESTFYAVFHIYTSIAESLLELNISNHLAPLCLFEKVSNLLFCKLFYKFSPSLTFHFHFCG